MLAAGVVLGGVASVMLVTSIVDYVDSPLALSSTSGLVVFQVGDGFGQYKPFEVGFAGSLLEVAVVLIVGAVLIGATLYNSPSRRSIAGTNADAQIR